MKPAELERFCALQPQTQSMLERAMDKLALSARGAHRVIRVARTLADLSGDEQLGTAHLGEALAYRGWIDSQAFETYCFITTSS